MAGTRMTGDSMRRPKGDGGARRRLVAAQAGGMGNTGFAVANVCGKMTWMSLPSTWVLTGAAPWFWPSTNFVGPYGIVWPEKVELASAEMIFARSALPARSIVSASRRTHE